MQKRESIPRIHINYGPSTLHCQKKSPPLLTGDFRCKRRKPSSYFLMAVLLETADVLGFELGLGAPDRVELLLVGFSNICLILFKAALEESMVSPLLIKVSAAALSLLILL